jgi:hypothetical protein
MVAQVDEQQVAVVALAMDPAGKPHPRADVGGAQLAASMGPVGVHNDGCSWGSKGLGRQKRTRKTHQRRRLVKAARRNSWQISYIPC